jgi:hypothetical protein
MHNRTLLIASLALAPAIVGQARAADVAATITADNHYALYTTGNAGLALVGRNELGAGGAPGTYNWSLPESWSFTAQDKIYIAAWSDDSVAQGLLAQIVVDGVSPLHSGDAKWEVFASHINRGDGDAEPTVPEMDALIAFATGGGLWEAPFVGGNNGVAPWGLIPDLTADARWMWWNTPGDADPLRDGSGAGELLVFRIDIPTPGSSALLALGGLALFRRRR